MCNTKALTELRKQITDTDRQLAGLFSKRMELSAQIGRIKSAAGLPVYDAGREKQVIENALSCVNEDCRSFYVPVIKAMLDVSKEYQKESNGKDK